MLAMVVSEGSPAAGVGATEAAADWKTSTGSPASSGAVGRLGRSSAGLLLFLSKAEGFDEELQLCGVLLEPSDAAALNGSSRAKAIDLHL